MIAKLARVGLEDVKRARKGRTLSANIGRVTPTPNAPPSARPSARPTARSLPADQLALRMS